MAFGYSWGTNTLPILLYLQLPKCQYLGPCAWILVAEIWPLSIRGKGISIAASSNWVSFTRLAYETLLMTSFIYFAGNLDEQLHRYVQLTCDYRMVFLIDLSLVGQVTPSMLAHISFGTFIFFGVSELSRF